MWLILFFMTWAQAAPAPPAASALSFDVYKAKIEPLFLEKRPGNARCVVCHARSTNFRLEALSPGQKAWTEEQSKKNFQMVSRFVLPGVPTKSRLLVMALAHEAGGVEFHPGGKHWQTQNDPEWKTMADWVKGSK
jgi:hypothetical protein